MEHKEVPRKSAIAVTAITAFTMSLTGSALNLSVPNISSEFGVTASVVGWLITAYMLTVAALSVPFGRWADITYRKRVLVTGIIIFSAASAGGMMAVSMKMLIIMRVIQGIGGAMVLSSNTPILLSAFPPSMRGKALGYSIGAVYIGLSLGPVLGGILNQQLGWRSIFAFAGGLALIALLIAAIRIPKIPSEGGDRSLDLPGNVLYVCFIVPFMYGLSKIGSGPDAYIWIAAGVAFGIGFILRELKTDDPALNISLFRTSIGYTLSNVAALMNYGATFAIGYLTSIYLQVVLGYSSQTAGLILIIQPAVMALLTPKMGRLSDKHSPFKMSSIGMGFCAVGAAFFIFIREDTGVAYIVAALLVTGLGFAFFSSPNTNAVMSFVEKKDYGIATSVLNTMRSIGQTSSMVIVTIVVALLLPKMQLGQANPAQLTHVINITFIIFTVMCIIGIFISLKRNKQ